MLQSESPGSREPGTRRSQACPAGLPPASISESGDGPGTHPARRDRRQQRALGCTQRTSHDGQAHIGQHQRPVQWLRELPRALQHLVSLPACSRTSRECSNSLWGVPALASTWAASTVGGPQAHVGSPSMIATGFASSRPNKRGSVSGSGSKSKLSACSGNTRHATTRSSCLRPQRAALLDAWTSARSSGLHVARSARPCCIPV